MMAERKQRTPEQKAASAAKAKETRAKNKKVKSAADYVSSHSVDAGLTATPKTTMGGTPLATPIRGSKDIEKEAKRRKTEYEGLQARKAERAERGFTPTSEAKFVGPTTGSWGLPRDPVKFARLTRRPSTRGHVSTADHVRQLEASADMLGVGTNVTREVKGEIRGLSKDSPVVPPHPTMIGRGENRRQVMYTNEYDRQAPVYTGGDISSGDFERWGVGGRPDLLDTIQSHQQIATPGFSRGDRTAGSQGAFSGMSPDALESAVKQEVIPDRINRQVSRLMKPGTVHRAPGIAKPYGLAGGGLTPDQKEMTDTVTVSKGGRTRTMTQAQHQERAEKQIAKRPKAEKTEEES